MPRYRTTLFEDLKFALRDQLVVASGHVHFEPSVQSDLSTDVIDIDLENVFLLGRRFLYQRGYRCAIRHADTIVLELNPRIINTWLALVECYWRRRRTVLWGHHLGRRAGETRPRFARRLQVRMSSALIAYTDHDAASMRAVYAGKPVYVAPNATERIRDSAVVGGATRTNFLYVGRLTTGKRPELLLSGFAAACSASLIPATAQLYFVGEGPLKARLQLEVRHLSLGDRVIFVDGTFDSEPLNDLYSLAVAGVCGGYVGLNITQSLSRGVPFVYPASANHSPEVSLARPGHNAFPFDPPSTTAAAAAFGEAWSACVEGRIDHAGIRKAVVPRYSIESMTAGFLEAVGASDRDRPISPDPLRTPHT